MHTRVGKLGGKVTRMSEQRGTQGPGGDEQLSPAQVGQNKLDGPGEAKGVFAAVTFHFRASCAGSLLRKQEKELPQFCQS